MYTTKQPGLHCIQTRISTWTPLHILIYQYPWVSFLPVPCAMVSKNYFLGKKILLVLMPGEKVIILLIVIL